MKKAAQIILGYDHHDEGRALDLHEKLKARGFRPWQNSHEIVGSQQWTVTMRKVVPESDFVFICLSKSTVNQYGILGKELPIIMDILFTKPLENTKAVYLCLDDIEIPKSLPHLDRIDCFREDGLQRLMTFLCENVELRGMIKPIRLRTSPRTLDESQLTAMLRENNFYDGLKNGGGRGIDHQYELLDFAGEKVVLDHTTGLCWQQDGSPNAMTYANIDRYLLELNIEGYAGCQGWRLPTLEEAMSLVQPQQATSVGLFLDGRFDKNQLWIWTTDESSATNFWIVYFYYGHCRVQSSFATCFVRAVRPIDDYILSKASTVRQKVKTQPAAFAAY